MKRKYHVQMDKHLKKIESHMTEIQRHLDGLYKITNALYTDSAFDEIEKKPKKRLKKVK